MCHDILLNNLKKNNSKLLKINFLKNKINKNIDNPKIKIDIIQLDDRKINIIQDGYLIAGTKQRVAKLFIKKILNNNKKIDTLLYAGSSNGFGAIATAYAAYKLGLKSHVFLFGNNNNNLINSRQILTLKSLDAHITLCETYREARILEFKISNNPKLKWSTLPNYYVAPMGLNDENGIMTDLLSKQIKKASKNTILNNLNNLRIWLVSGSGGIAESILKAFPNAYLFILLTGSGSYKKRVIEWSKKHNKNITIINNFIINESNISNINLYYSSVKNYDDLIWSYVKKYAKDGDFIWNVASDNIDMLYK
jgi:hypothetical protein